MNATTQELLSVLHGVMDQAEREVAACDLFNRVALYNSPGEPAPGGKDGGA